MECSKLNPLDGSSSSHYGAIMKARDYARSCSKAGTANAEEVSELMACLDMTIAVEFGRSSSQGVVARFMWRHKGGYWVEKLSSTEHANAIELAWSCTESRNVVRQAI